LLFLSISIETSPSLLAVLPWALTLSSYVMMDQQAQAHLRLLKHDREDLFSLALGDREDHLELPHLTPAQEGRIGGPWSQSGGAADCISSATYDIYNLFTFYTRPNPGARQNLAHALYSKTVFSYPHESQVPQTDPHQKTQGAEPDVSTVHAQPTS
jgi:hypothetical protein